MAAICAATCEADPGRDKYPKSVAANDKTTIIYFYSFASKLFPGLCLSLASLSVCPSICLPLCHSLARTRALYLFLACHNRRSKQLCAFKFKFIRSRN